MPHGHQAAHRHHARSPFNWPSGDDIWSAIEAPFQPAKQKTVTSYVYSTMKPTFTGSIAGYVTPKPNAKSDDDESTTSTKSKAVASAKETSSKAKSTSKTTAHSTTFAKSTASPTESLIQAQQTKSSATASSTASSDSLAQDSTATSGMSTGGKAGLAIGIIALIGAAVLFAFFLFRRHKKRVEREEASTEKTKTPYDPNPFSDPARAPSTRTARTASTAPRLSLRPVTQFLPTFADRRTSRGNALQVASEGTAMNANRSLGPTRNSWESPVSAESQVRENPFGNHAEAVDPVNAAGPAPVEHASAFRNVGAGAAGGAAVGAVAAGAAVGLKRGASKRENGPQPFDFTKNNPNVGGQSTASPTGTDYSMSEAPNTPMQTNGTAVIAAAGGPQNTSVHRVQLDFVPSMDDELELRTGQLVRLLHEYDDGWALCIRLDRSQQGVAPRTCLSTRPVKPRPGPGPNGMPRGNPPPGMRVPGHMQQGRPQSPAGGRQMGPYGGPQGRPMGPNGGPPGPQGRPMTPNGGPQGRSMTPNGGPQGRPMTPNGGPQGRPMTPTGSSQSRSMSPGPRNGPYGQQGNERRITPPGPSRMNPSPEFSTSPQDVPLPFDSSAQASPRSSPSTSPHGSISQVRVGRKPVPGQAM